MKGKKERASRHTAHPSLNLFVLLVSIQASEAFFFALTWPSWNRKARKEKKCFVNSLPELAIISSSSILMKLMTFLRQSRQTQRFCHRLSYRAFNLQHYLSPRCRRRCYKLPSLPNVRKSHSLRLHCFSKPIAHRRTQIGLPVFLSHHRWPSVSNKQRATF